MTDKLYYRDATLREFDARVVRSDEGDDGRFLSVLDRTVFYPTSGGQPFDLGRLGDVPIVDVMEGDDGEIVHVTGTRLLVGTEVHGEIDWPRRFDHMQQHTGQHLLSAAFERTCEAATVSVHFGGALSTIDLGREVTPAEIDAAEDAANRVVWEDRLVSLRFVDAADAGVLPLRKESKRTGTLRLVEVAGFDLSACGGTHVSRTGEIGVVTVSAWERYKTGTRITFRCGKRALDGYRVLRQSVADAARVLSVGPGEIGPAIARFRDDLRGHERGLAELGSELARYRAAEWRTSAETIGPFRGVLRVEPGADGAAIKAAAQAVVAGETGLVVFVAGGGRPTPVVAARSADLTFDAGAFIKSLTAALGGRGGGRAELAQGGVEADSDRVLATARQLLAAAFTEM